MSAHLDPAAFEIQRAEVRPGVETAFVRAGAGGVPLLLAHGWPETKRIWWGNIAPLAAAGFEVVVPDLRGFGDPSLAPDEHYDLAASARDLHSLVHDVLGHERCVAAGGDYGGAIIQDLGLRFEGFVARQCLFNTVLPLLDDAYETAGLRPLAPREARVAADYFLRQGREADALAAELDTPEKRRRYVGEMYGRRLWAAPGAFTPDDVDFMTEPFANAAKLRASLRALRVGLGDAPGFGAAPLLRAQPAADPPALRPGGPRHLARLPRAVRDRLHRANRPLRGPAGRALPPVGASGSIQPRGGVFLAASDRLAL